MKKLQKKTSGRSSQKGKIFQEYSRIIYTCFHTIQLIAKYHHLKKHFKALWLVKILQLFGGWVMQGWSFSQSDWLIDEDPLWHAGCHEGQWYRFSPKYPQSWMFRRGMNEWKSFGSIEIYRRPVRIVATKFQTFLTCFVPDKKRSWIFGLPLRVSRPVERILASPLCLWLAEWLLRCPKGAT